jgi:hypothetical protein
MNLEVRPDLVFCVELWGFEPQTSCMPWGMLTFTIATCQARTSCAHDGPSTYACSDGQTAVKIPSARISDLDDRT